MNAKFQRRDTGMCQDCGHTRPVRWFVFWLNGYRMRLCAVCEKVYAKRGEPARV